MKKLLIILVLSSIGTVVCSQPYKSPVTLNPNSGYVNINELTSGLGLGDATLDYSKYFYGLTTTHGYQLNIYGLRVNSSLAAGLGTGILFYNGGPLFPLYGDIRFTSNRGRISPFIFVRSGFLFSVNDFSAQSRQLVNAGGGVSFKYNENIAVVISPGIFVQMGNNVYRDTFVDLKIGVVYKPE